jgi:hypothetical protein
MIVNVNVVFVLMMIKEYIVLINLTDVFKKIEIKI